MHYKLVLLVILKGFVPFKAETIAVVPKENAPSGFGLTKFRDLGTELLQMGE